MKLRILALLTALVPAILMGQTLGSVSGPSLGFVFDSNAGMVRRLPGIPGSAMVGEPVLLGYSITDAHSLRDEQYILAAPQEGPDLVSVNLATNPPDTRVITGAAKSAQITLSPNGKAAALTYPRENLIKVITGLPDKPVVSREITTSSFFSGPPHHVAVNDDSSALLVSFIGNTDESIYRWNAAEGFRFLTSASQVGAMMFVGPSDAVYTDSGSNEVFTAREVQSMSVTQFIAGPEDGVSSPIGIGISGKFGYFVANAGSRTIMIFDNSGHLRQTLECSCAVSGLHVLGSGTYRLTDQLNQILYILADNGMDSRILFVPQLRPDTPAP